MVLIGRNRPVWRSERDRRRPSGRAISLSFSICERGCTGVVGVSTVSGTTPGRLAGAAGRCTSIPVSTTRSCGPPVRIRCSTSSRRTISSCRRGSTCNWSTTVSRRARPRPSVLVDFIVTLSTQRPRTIRTSTMPRASAVVITAFPVSPNRLVRNCILVSISPGGRWREAGQLLPSIAPKLRRLRDSRAVRPHG